MIVLKYSQMRNGGGHKIALCSIKTLNSHLSTKLWVKMWLKILENWNYLIL